MKKPSRKPPVELRPHIPGLSREMVQAHATRLFRDVLHKRRLTPAEWRLAEADLARKLERDGF